MPGVDLVQKLLTAADFPTVKKTANELVELVRVQGPDSPTFNTVFGRITKECKNRKQPQFRESAVAALGAMVEGLGRGWDAIIVEQTELILDLLADPGKHIRTDAEAIKEILFELLPPESCITTLFPILATYISSPSAKWQSKVGALELLGKISRKAPARTAGILPDIIPVVERAMLDIKKEVGQAAAKSMTNIADVIQNRDIRPHLPALIEAMASPVNVPDVVKELAGVTFVADVDGPTLAIMVPLLERALKIRNQQTMRRTVIVLKNLCKLVVEPTEAVKFLPALLPELERAKESATWPEVQQLSDEAHQVMIDAQAGLNANEVDHSKVAVEDVIAAVSKIISDENDITQPVSEIWTTVLNYVARNARSLFNNRVFAASLWEETYVSPYLALFFPIEKSLSVSQKLRSHFLSLDKANHASNIPDPDDGEEPLAIVENFSLGYGERILIDHSELRLYKGHRYAILGRNGAGKSTLLTNIAQGKVKGFPSKQHVRTCLVHNNGKSDKNDHRSVMEFLETDDEIHSTQKEIEDLLEERGFNEYRRRQEVSALSGGWNMKLQIARAMLIKPNLLLLDEPTNHLDSTNVSWFEQYLLSNPDITVLVISHDTNFLDTIATDVIHYERDQTLSYHRGNLATFVQARPEAKTYYKLTNSYLKFKLPPPGFMKGNSLTKSVLRMKNIYFTYPGASECSLYDVSVSLSRASRVAIIGANGAGKSTLIKVLKGDLMPQSGTTWKDSDLRIGYVAQHAFDHVDKHLNETPVAYIRWRFQKGFDMEQTREVSPEDLLLMRTVPITCYTEEDELLFLKRGHAIPNPPESRYIEEIVMRTKFKHTHKYEIKWRGKDSRFNSKPGFTKQQLTEWGFASLVHRHDDYRADQEGLGARELRTEDIKQLFEDVGLEGTIAEHTEIKGLSGGQKVKVVLAAAMWNRPHILILDEPTNYLDRDSLGGLAVALEEWAGGVCMISHHVEFFSALCKEQWYVEAGRVTKRGEITPVVDDEETENVLDGTNLNAKTTSSSRTSTPPLPNAAGDEEVENAHIKIEPLKKGQKPGAKSRGVKIKSDASTPNRSGTSTPISRTGTPAGRDIETAVNNLSINRQTDKPKKKKYTRAQLKERDSRASIRRLEFVARMKSGEQMPSDDFFYSDDE